MSIYLTARCGHQVPWPTNPPSDVRREIEDGLCSDCYARRDPDSASEDDMMISALEEEGARILADEK